jgi:hypothetical protein
MNGRQVRSPDGREWLVRVRRIQMPRWHDSNFEPSVIPVTWIMAPVHWFVFPLIRLIGELAFRSCRSLLSSARWLEAIPISGDGAKMMYRTSRDYAANVAEQLAQELSAGRESPQLEGAEPVWQGRSVRLVDLR